MVQIDNEIFSYSGNILMYFGLPQILTQISNINHSIYPILMLLLQLIIDLDFIQLCLFTITFNLKIFYNSVPINIIIFHF